MAPQSESGLEVEEWRPLQCGYYEVSNQGQVRRSVPGRRTSVGKILKIQQSNRYPHVILSLGNRNLKQVFVHQLVAEAFLGECPLGMEVNHKDLNKRNCRSDNLEYVTPRGNKDHALSKGAYPSGEAHPLARLKEAEVRVIRENTDLAPKELAVLFGVTVDHIRAIRRRRIWKQI
jgi:DNA-binding transcriptional regulator YiaG